MPYADLRQFITRLEGEGELKRVKAQVDWNLELGAVSRIGLERKGPALLFEKIKDYPGHRVLANLLGPTSPAVHGRLALAMELDKGTSAIKLIEELSVRSRKQIKPKLVDRGPCQENVLKGNDVDLTKLPVPLIHGTDGGRYIGTWHIDVCRDPDTGWVNWGMYRHMLQDERSIGWLCMAAQHGPAIFYQKYAARGKPMPIAIAMGTEPISSILAGTGVPAQVDEVDVVGGIRGQAVELVKCQTVDLEVPASAEIVLEGMVYPGELKEEGDFGEFTGYCAGGRAPRQLIRITCVTHRNDPVFSMTNVGKPWDENSIIQSVAYSAFTTNELRDRGVPFKSLYFPPPCLAIVVAAPQPYPGYTHTLASAIWSCKAGLMRPYIIVVGEDVDVTDPEEVFWCLTTRLHPEKGIHSVSGSLASPLFPFLSPKERKELKGARVLLDATFPAEWAPEDRPRIIDFERAWPQEIRDKVLARWKEYGLGE